MVIKSKMTKDELLDLVEELEIKFKELENDIDYWQKEYNDIAEQADDLQSQVDDLNMKGGINDLSNFIYRLKVDGFYCDKLQQFINEYLRYHND